MEGEIEYSYDSKTSVRLSIQRQQFLLPGLGGLCNAFQNSTILGISLKSALTLINSVNKYLFMSYYVTGSMSGTGNAKMKRHGLLEDHSVLGEEADT